MSPVSICPSCREKLRLPEEPGRYRCPKCQTVIEVSTEDASEESAGRPRARRRFGSRTDEERWAAADIRRFANQLKGVRGFLIVCAILPGLILLAQLLTVSQTGAWLPLLLNGLVFVVLVVAAVQVVVQPFVWTLMAALIETPVAVTLVLFAPVFDLTTLAHLLVFLFLWGTVLGSLQLRRKLAELPDLQVTRTLLVERGRLRRVSPGRAAAGATTEQAKRRRRARAGNRRAMGIAVGGSIVAFIAAIVLVVKLSQPPAVDDALGSFRAAWNDSSATLRPARLAGFFPTAHEDRMRSRLRRRFDRFGWTKDAPSLGDPRIARSSSGSVTAHFPLPTGDEVTTYWSLDDGGWRLAGIKYPKGLSDDGD